MILMINSILQKYEHLLVLCVQDGIYITELQTSSVLTAGSHMNQC